MGIKTALNRDPFNDQDHDQKIKYKPRTSKGTPSNKNASWNQRTSTLRGSRGSDRGRNSRVGLLTSPLTAPFATRIEKVNALDSSLPSSQQPSTYSKSAQKNSITALKKQRLKAGSPQLLRDDLGKPLTMYITTH